MTPLMYAVKDNRTAFLDRMIDLGADVGARNNVRCCLITIHFFSSLDNLYIYIRHSSQVNLAATLIKKKILYTTF